MPPVSDGSGQDRALLRKASAAAAARPASRIKDGKRVTPKGERITIEFLIDEPTFQPHHMPFIKNLGDARHRGDACASSIRCSTARASTISISISPSSASASPPRPAIRCAPISPRRRPRSRARRISPASPIRSIDALIDKIIARREPAELVTACKALDRVIRAGRYWIPHWYKASHWIAYWDVFARPAEQAALCAAASRKPGGTIADKAAKLER